MKYGGGSDRQTWQRGVHHGHPHPCAIDFIGGTFDEAARHTWWRTSEFHTIVKMGGFDIVDVNDDPTLPEREREMKLVELCAKAGYALTFIN